MKRVMRMPHFIMRRSLLPCVLAVIVAMMAVDGTQAFMVPSSRTIRFDVGKKGQDVATTERKSIIEERFTVSELRMSDFPRDQEDDKNKRTAKRKKFRLPPPPEDQFTMTGDLIVLFLYGFMDHLVNDVYLTSVLISSPSAEAAAKALDPSGDVVRAGSLPVWVDTTWTSVSDQVLRSGLQHQVLPAYAPVLSTAGLASVSLAFCWLLAGYCLQAFSFKNTLDCSTHRVVQVTGKAWLLCSFFMLVLAFLSRYYLEGSLDSSALGVDQTTRVMSQLVPAVAQPSSPLQVQLGMLTVSDTDYIFNSLGVLLTWRVMISLLLGYGSDD